LKLWRGTRPLAAAACGLAVLSEASTTRTELLRRRTATTRDGRRPWSPGTDRLSVSGVLTGGHDRRPRQSTDNELEEWRTLSRYCRSTTVFFCECTFAPELSIGRPYHVL